MAASNIRRVCGLLLAIAALCAGAPARAADAPVAPQVKAQVLERYRVLLIQDGVVLTPRRGAARSIEVSATGIAVDGVPVTGAELRDRVGEDAGLILQLSYASPEALRTAFGGAPPAAAPEPAPQPPDATTPATPSSEARGEEAVPPAPEASTPAPPAPPSAPERPMRKHSAKINFGGNIVVEEDELVTDPVVAIGGSVQVLGHVQDDVVAIGGDVELGPHAVVDGSVTSVGGGIDQAPGAEVHGEVNEVAFARGMHTAWPGMWSHGIGREFMSGWLRLFGTLLRIALVLLLALILTVIAARPVDRIARRAGDEPWMCGFVGLMAQVLLVPVTILAIVVLAITIIGIPLLLLVPFALLALVIGTVLGFVGVARRVGEWVAPGRGPLVGTVLGVVLIASVTILSRLLWLMPGPIAPIAIIVAIIGFFLEYIAWTVGIGAMLLTRFGTRGPELLEPVVIVPPIPPAPPLAPEGPLAADDGLA